MKEKAKKTGMRKCNHVLTLYSSKSSNIRGINHSLQSAGTDTQTPAKILSTKKGPVMPGRHFDQKIYFRSLRLCGYFLSSQVPSSPILVQRPFWL